MDATQAPADIISLVFVTLSLAFEPVPGIDLDDTGAMSDNSDLSRVEQPVQIWLLLGMEQKQIMLVDPCIGLGKLFRPEIALKAAAEQRP
jgi:hypothetical protein